MPPAVLLWLRRDLRLLDNPALTAAVASGAPVVPVFVWSPAEERPFAPGAATRWWLAGSLESLGEALRKQGGRLVLRQGAAAEELRTAAQECGATDIYCNEHPEPAGRKQDAALRDALALNGLRLHVRGSAFLAHPDVLSTKNAKPYLVFTAFWRRMQAELRLPEACKPPPRWPAPQVWPPSLTIEALQLRPVYDWAAGLRDTWIPGEEAAHDRLETFLGETCMNYVNDRDFPDRNADSGLSPYLHFGELSAATVWRRANLWLAREPEALHGISGFLRQIAWREFALHLLDGFPATPTQNLNHNLDHIAWRSDDAQLQSWQQGKTGYPLVDAGMRQLWATGTMHNRVRMVAASFLVKDLLLPWQLGARWFWDTLVDADLANNTMGWQWVAGCGADAAPFFRVFNPTLQARKFDPQGGYIRRWIPELRSLALPYLHAPDQAPPLILRAAGISADSPYAAPMIDHAWARARALQAKSERPYP